MSTINPEGSTFSIRSLRSNNHRSGTNSFKSTDINRVPPQIEYQNRPHNQNQRPIQFNQGPLLHGYMSPSNKMNSPPPSVHVLRNPQKPINYQTNRVVKSPEGYYAPKNIVTNVKPFKVFIQYKSPTRPIDKPRSVQQNVRTD